MGGGSSNLLVFIRLDVAPVGLVCILRVAGRRPAEEDGKIRGSAGFLLQGHRLEWKAEREAEKLTALPTWHCRVHVPPRRRTRPRTPLIKNAIAARR